MKKEDTLQEVELIISTHVCSCTTLLSEHQKQNFLRKLNDTFLLTSLSLPLSLRIICYTLCGLEKSHSSIKQLFLICSVILYFFFPFPPVTHFISIVTRICNNHRLSESREEGHIKQPLILFCMF